MVLAGKRMLDESLFLEPSTGAAYPLGASPYYAVEALWNSANYWVNMHPKPPSALSFGSRPVTDRREYVLLDKDSAPGAVRTDEEDGEDAAPPSPAPARRRGRRRRSRGAGDDEKLELDMPPSWVARLHIPRDARYEGRTPAGMKATLYRKARVSSTLRPTAWTRGWSSASPSSPTPSASNPSRCAAPPRPALPSAPPPPSPPPPTRLPLTSPALPTADRRHHAFRKDKLAERIVKPEEATTIERFAGGPRGCASTCSSKG